MYFNRKKISIVAAGQRGDKSASETFTKLSSGNFILEVKKANSSMI